MSRAEIKALLKEVADQQRTIDMAVSTGERNGPSRLGRVLELVARSGWGVGPCRQVHAAVLVVVCSHGVAMFLPR